MIKRPILFTSSANQRAPSGPVVIPCGRAFAVGRPYSLISPFVLIFPILLPRLSTNPRAPSGPEVTPTGPAPAVGMGYSIISSLVVILPILLLCEPECASSSHCNNRWEGMWSGKVIFDDVATCRDSADLVALRHRKPERIVRSCSDQKHSCASSEERIFSDLPACRNSADPLAFILSEPERTISSHSNTVRS